MYPVLETERTILKPYNEQYYDFIFELIKAHRNEFKDTFTDINTVEDAKKELSLGVKQGVFWLIIFKETQRPIGWSLCDKALGFKIAKRTFIHTWIRSEYRHMGLGREILLKKMNFSFYGIQTENVVTNVKNNEKKAYQLMTELGFEIYNHFPKTKTITDETTIQFKISKEKYTRQEYAYMDVYDYEPPKIFKSPYSYKNPIRKIDGITYVKQPTIFLCGQAVIAMLANVSVNEVIEVMQNDKGTTVPMMRNALKWYGLKTSTNARQKYTVSTVLPDCCILGMRIPGDLHWSLYYKGKFYDPQFGVLDSYPQEGFEIINYWQIVI